MKKITILIATLLATTFIATAGNNAPFIKFGAKFGITSEKQNVTLKDNGLQDILNDASTGYHAGITARVKIPVVPIHVQGEFLYNWNKLSKDPKIKLSYFSAPVLAGVGIGIDGMANIRVQLGPVFNFGNKITTGNDEIAILETLLQKPAVTWAAGLGVDFLGIMIDARYNGQFKTNKVTLSDLPGNIDAKPTSWTVSIGFMF